MLPPDHGLHVVPEDDLGVGIVLRLQNIDGLVGVNRPEAALRQLSGNAGTQHRRTIQAQDRIHRGIIDKMGHQLLGAVLRLAEAGFLEGDVHIIIDMGMVGGKMAPGDTQRRVAPADGEIHQGNHRFSLL